MILDRWYQKFDLHQIFCFVCSQLKYLSDDTSCYIIKPFSSSFVKNTSLPQMADQYGLLPEDYVDDLKSVSNRRYSQGVLFLVLSNNGWSLFKSLLLLWCYMILSITFLNKWVFPFLKDDSTYIFCLRSSISTGMFPIQWLTIVTDIWNLRGK